VQTACAGQPPGNQPELIDSDWDEAIFREQTLGVPARRDTGDPMFKRGVAWFREARCDVCQSVERIRSPALQAGQM
jgi:CxxC motif-containing protein (DUF1111 family)